MTAKSQTDVHPTVNVRKDTRIKNLEVNSEKCEEKLLKLMENMLKALT